MKIFWRFSLAFLSALNPSSAFDKCENNVTFNRQAFAYSKSLEWTGYLGAFTPFKDIGQFSVINIEKMMRCKSIKIKYFEEEQKISINIGCATLCRPLCDSYCLSLKEQANNSIADYTWKVTHYAHLTYGIIKYSFNSAKAIHSGLIIFVDTYDTWKRNEAKFENILKMSNITALGDTLVKRNRYVDHKKSMSYCYCQMKQLKDLAPSNLHIYTSFIIAFLIITMIILYTINYCVRRAKMRRVAPMQN